MTKLAWLLIRMSLRISMRSADCAYMESMSKVAVG